MRFKEQGNIILATILVSALFLGLIGGAWYLFQWFEANNPPLKEIPVVESPPIDQIRTTSEVTTLSKYADLQTHLQNLKEKLEPSAIEVSLAAGFAIHEIGSTAWTDAEYGELSKLLKANPEIRKHVALEFRINTDPKKAKRLAALLGQFDDEIITDVGLELALSGEIISQKNGLSLLAKQQPHNAKARGAIVEILQAESAPEILVSALNAVAVLPKTNVTDRQALLNQFTNLSNNPDPRVRAHSMSMMSRWAGKENVNEYLLQGLKDDDPQVRKTAAYSLLKTRHLSDEVKSQLLERTQDESEQKRTREAAIMALERFNLSENEQQHLSNIRKSIR